MGAEILGQNCNPIAFVIIFRMHRFRVHLRADREFGQRGDRAFDSLTSDQSRAVGGVLSPVIPRSESQLQRVKANRRRVERRSQVKQGSVAQTRMAHFVPEDE